MTYVLIIIMTIWRGPVATTAEFNSLAACEHAITVIKETQKKADSKWNSFSCVPKGKPHD